MSERDQVGWSRPLVRLGLPRWMVLVTLGSLGLVLAQVGHASDLAATADKLGAGSASITTCDPDGLSFHYTSNNSGQVTQVSVSGIHAGCAGGTLRLTLRSGSTSVGSGSVSLPATGFTGTAIVSISPQPAANLVTAAQAAIEGP